MQNVDHRTSRGAAVYLTFAVLTMGMGCQAEASSMVDGDNLVLGAGAAAGPRYSGSNQSTAAPILLLDYSLADGLFASTMRGVGYGGQVGGFSYSAALGFRGGRKEKNQIATFGDSGSDRLQGMGEIKGNTSAALGVGYMFLPGFQLGLTTDIPLTQKDNGKSLHATLTGQVYEQGNDRVSFGLTAGFGDSKYAQTYYGVTEAQAARSRFSAYQAGTGLYEVNATLTWGHKIDDRWSITSVVGANHLLKDAARSPLAERKTAPTAMVYATYNF